MKRCSSLYTIFKKYMMMHINKYTVTKGHLRHVAEQKSSYIHKPECG